MLFFKPGAIGDLLHTLPALKALKKKFPTAQITMVVSPGLESLIQGTPLADRIQVFDKSKLKKRLKDFIFFGLGLRAEQYDVFIDLQPSLRSLIIRRLGNARMTLVYKKQKRFATRDQRLHAVENFIQTLAPLDIHNSVDAIELPISSDALRSIALFFSARNIDRSKPLIALNCSVGAARPARNWFSERFAALADHLIQDLGAVVVFVGGVEDRNLVQGVMGRMKEKAVCAAGELTLPESAALLAQSACLVSSDTGPLHLGTATGIPVVGLYGSTDPRRTGPVGRGHRVLIKELACVPCEKKTCSLGTRDCMAEITVEEVFKAVKKAIACC